jgi:putative sterol carrier protein
MPQRPGERVEPDWLRLAMAAYVPKGPTPARSFNIRIPAGEKEAVIHVRGGPDGTTIAAGPAPADVEITADFPTVLGLTVGLIDPSDALDRGVIQAEGDLNALSTLPQLFEAIARQGGSV